MFSSSSLHSITLRKKPRRLLFGALGVTLALAFVWLCIPGTRDRIVKADGAVVCNDPLDIGDIESFSSPAMQRLQIGDLVASQSCRLLLANDRVRLEELSTDGSKAKISTPQDDRKVWIANSALRSLNDRWFSAPWFWYRIFPSDTGTAVAAETASEESSKVSGDLNAVPTSTPELEDSPNPFDKFSQPEARSRRISLRPWLSIELASGWEPNDKAFGESVALYMQDRGMDGEKTRDSFMARKLDALGLKSVAQTNVRFYPDQPLTQNQVVAITNEKLSAFDAALHQSLQEVAVRSGFRIEVWTGTALEKIAGLNMLVTRYTRSSRGNDPGSNVSLFRVLDGPHSFTLTTSYALDANEDSKAEAEKIAQTILVSRSN